MVLVIPTRLGARPAVGCWSAMQRQSIEYRQLSTPAQRRPMLRSIVFVAASVLLVVSVICCLATLSSPRRFIFLPGGDVGLGFRSYAGSLQWIEFAGWQANPDYVQWSLPWPAVFVVEAMVIALCVLRRRPRVAACSADAPDRAGG
jgi:hypothetical protein